MLLSHISKNVALELMSGSCNSLEVHARKCLYCCEWTFQGDSSKNWERKENCSASLSLRENLSHPEHNVGRNTDSKVHYDVV